MLRPIHIFPLFLLVSIPLISMENSDSNALSEVKVGQWKKAITHNDDGTEAIHWLFDDSPEETTPVTQTNRPHPLTATISLITAYQTNQIELERIKQEEEKIKQQEIEQAEKANLTLQELQQRLAGKQAAEVGANLTIMKLEEQIKILQQKITEETSTRDEHIKAAQELKDAIALKPGQISQEKAKKRGWFW